MSAYPMPRDGHVPPDAVPTVDWLSPHLMRWGVIIELAAMNGWTRGAEVGCADARTTAKVLAARRDMNMVAVDLWAPQPGNTGPEDWADWPHAEYEAEAAAVARKFYPRCRILKGRSVDVAKTIEAGSLDFVFLDGDHGEDGVRADIDAWLPTIRRGGMLLAHDINWTGPQAALAHMAYEIGPNNVAMIQL